MEKAKQLKEELEERKRKKTKTHNESPQEHSDVCSFSFCHLCCPQPNNSVDVQDATALMVLLEGAKGLMKVADSTYKTMPNASTKKGLARRSSQRQGPRYIATAEKTAIPNYEQFAATFHRCEINLKMWIATELPSWSTDDEQLKMAIGNLLQAKRVVIKPTSIKIFFPRAVCLDLSSTISVCLGRLTSMPPKPKTPCRVVTNDSETSESF
jgi:hypothetical protein